MEITTRVRECLVYDRYEELKTFDETKAGVKGIVDAGIAKIPRMFIRPQDELNEDLAVHTEHRYDIGGLQFLNQNHWFNVKPIPGTFVVNIDDILQLISNGKFKSVEHRVLVNHVGPRVSVACFVRPTMNRSTKLYGPI
ncbi:1-aminocyclopropane-1-carboxylate oxidase homolog [Papaver somniferum]|uniref:1-aminocyclopropane-1-carboxylate oxidase homolog n=1 Tax=Papaver somniferum TaxID=3469 RepID=UPI000E6F9D80|nr:1-aminocyclopropane-1-carboxylate oxidase homolog [Papaver somniferum]